MEHLKRTIPAKKLAKMVGPKPTPPKPKAVPPPLPPATLSDSKVSGSSAAIRELTATVLSLQKLKKVLDQKRKDVKKSEGNRDFIYLNQLIEKLTLVSIDANSPLCMLWWRYSTAMHN